MDRKTFKKIELQVSRLKYAQDHNAFWQQESNTFKLLRKYLRLYRTPLFMKLDLEDNSTGWGKRERKLKELVPIQYFFRDEVPTFFGRLSHRLSNVKWAIQDYFNPHNIIKIRSLGRGYADKDTLLEAFLIQTLLDFVEQEEPYLGHVKECEKQTAKNKEIKKLYKFFKTTYPKLKLQLEEKLNSGQNYLTYYKDLDKLDSLVTKNLVLLILIRKHLWT